MLVIVQILENLVLLTFLGLGFYAIERTRPHFNGLAVSALHGLAFGAVAFLVTATPVSMGDGATVDARAGPVVLAGAVAGPVAAGIAAAFGGLARGLVGGSFAFSGVVVYLVYAFLGTLFWVFLRKAKRDFLNWRFILALAAASCLGAAGMFFLIEPQERAMAWLQNDLPYIWLANVLSVAFASLALGTAWNVLSKAHTIEDIYETLQLAKRAGGFGIWEFNVETGKLDWDERSRQLHGLSVDAFSGSFEDWSRSLHPEDIDRAQTAFSEALAHSDTFEAEYRVVHPDGTQKVIKGDAVIIRDAAGKATRVVGANLDLTEIRLAEERLQEAQLVAVQAQKFDTIGQLTGGVAHDFNNLLAVIMGNLELIADEVERDHIDKEEVQGLLRASLEATRRGADLTQNMLAYARKARLSPEILDLNDVVRETESWMRRTIPSTIDIETNLQAGLWQTLADRSSLQSALINLLVNARDAFDGPGEVTIETGNLRVEPDYITERHEDIRPGRYVMLAVSDNGCGIDPDMLGSIFDPFFTTKRVGEGSGLGLSMVQGFVKQSGGTIRVYSEPAIGTSFKMYFPAVAPEEQEQLARKSPPVEDGPPKQTGSRILLVEDRAEVLTVLKKTLEASGYDVVTATSGDEGFQVFSRLGGFDLVVTDIVMPGTLQGPSMAREIRALRPDMKFVFLSGYASEATVHGNGVRSDDVRLMKPVSRSALLNAVATCLGSNKSDE